MRIIFYGGKQAGLISLFTLKAMGQKIVCIVPEDKIVEMAAKKMKLKVFKPKDINSENSVVFFKKLKSDLIVCCHGRKILKKKILELPKKGCINIHPCLYKYKGADPIGRMLSEGEKKASVGVHCMVEKVDSGKVLSEKFVNAEEAKTVVEVYNILYPYYSTALIEAIQKIEKKNPKN